MTRSPVLLAWRAANNFGWGIAGLNIFYQWARSPEVGPLMAFPIRDVFVSDADPADLHGIFTAIVNSNKFSQRIAGGDGTLKLEIPVVHALGNQFASGMAVVGSANFGRAVFEDTDIRNGVNLDKVYDAMVCASNWNAEIIRAHSSVPVHVIHETVDHSLFFPAAKTGLFSPDRFYIFTGGKIEFRKAQDLVLLAFRTFSQRHDDAVLVTAWHSPWDESLAGFQGKLDAPAQVNGEGRLDVPKWARDNGVDPGKIIDLGAMPNQSVPTLLREMDCALQPSRAEGGTNFVAMEAMACGLPVIVPKNTGMFDVIDGDNCIPLERQSPVDHPDDMGTSGWGESDVEEIVEALERLYTSADLRKRVGARASAFMKTRTWAAHADRLKTLVFGGR
jgi:glycosyltransferase involved in cell wall biosynthesis